MKPRYLFILAVFAAASAAALWSAAAGPVQAAALNQVQRLPDGTLSLRQVVNSGPLGTPMLLEATAVPPPSGAAKARTLASARGLVTIMSEDFEPPQAWPPPPVPDQPAWSVYDGNGEVDGEYFWDDTDFRAHNGEWSAWCARGGTNGYDPGVDPTYRDNMRSWAVFGPFSLVGATSAALNFYEYLHSEQDHDYFWWLASVDGIRFYGYAESGNPYQDKWSSVKSLSFQQVPFLGSLLGRSEVWIAFLFTSDSAKHNSLGVLIDDLTIKKLTEINFDLVADRVWTGDEEGNEISSPEAGQEVYFYFDWHVNGTGTTPTPFVVECRLDDEVYSYEVRDAEGGLSYSTRSNVPWVVEEGEHVIEWRLDPQDPPPGEQGNVLPETDEGNNDASLLINPPSGAWTYLVYLNGDTDFAGRADAALSALEDAADNPDLNILALYDGPSSNDSLIYRVNPNRVYQPGINVWRVSTYGTPYGEPGEANMGHPDTLKNFVNWARGAFPADYCALCIWDHAFSPDPGIPQLVRGICWDRVDGGDYLTLPELTTALEGISSQHPGMVDVLHFSTDLMGMCEVAYQVGEAHYVVASENPMSTPEPYAAYLSGLTGLSTGTDLAQTIVEQYHLATSALGHTIAAYDIGAADPVKLALDELADSLIAGLTDIALRETFLDAITAAWTEAQKFDSAGNGICDNSDVYLDAADLAAKLVTELDGLEPLVQDARTKAQAFAAILEVAAGNFIFAEAHQSGPSLTGGTYDLSDAQGIALYFPASTDSPGWLPYNNLGSAPANLAMVAGSHWDEFLQAFFSGPPAAPSDFSHSAQTIDSITWTWVDNSYNEDEFRVYDEGAVIQVTAGANETSVIEGGLSPNTGYTRYVRAYSAILGESTSSNLATAYTLPVAPDVTCDLPTPGSYPEGTVFTFTNAAGWGPGSLDHYRYVWDTNPTHTWAGTEPVWDTGTLALTGAYMGHWYLHVNSYNPAGESGGFDDYGPFDIFHTFDCLSWNLISLPFEPIDPDPYAVFLSSGYDPTNRLYRYDPAAMSYIGLAGPEDPLGFGDMNTHDAYWLIADEPVALSYDYVAPPMVPTPDSRVLAQGWNMIGAGSPSEVPLAEVWFNLPATGLVDFQQAVTNGWVEMPTWGYSCSLGSYQAIILPDGIWLPWQGAWIFVVETDVTMTVNVSAP